MIILDEQLLGRNLEQHIAAWYKGAVHYITDLRPNTVIKDDAIPMLLRQIAEPTFVTINESDFWRKVAISPHFCVICFVSSDVYGYEIADKLRLVLSQQFLKTKTQRMGKVVRISNTHCQYYSWDDLTIYSIEL